jgi:glycosyltransferase involved in cell wall biosynthesis
MKTLLISHTCMSRTMGQPKLHGLAAYSDVDLTALVPDRMCTYGRWSQAELPEEAPFRFEVGRTRWQNVFNQWYLLHYTADLSRLLREVQPDVIDIWEEPWSLVCAQAIVLARRICPKAKIIVETEQNIYKRLPFPFAQFQSYSLKHADAMVARSTEASTVLRQKGYGGPVRVVPNAVDCGLFEPLPAAERLEQRLALGWGGPEDFVYGYVGRLVPEKGLSDAVAALAMLPENARLVFVGEGTMQEALKAQAQELNVASRVVFAGSKPLTELPGVMNAMDVLILPSRTTPSWKEQFGRVLIEAGACGIPVVGSDSGAIPEVIADGGLVFPEGDAAALAECLRRLSADSACREAMGQVGYRRAKGMFSWECVAAHMHGLYRGVLERVGGGAPAKNRSVSSAGGAPNMNVSA